MIGKMVHNIISEKNQNDATANYIDTGFCSVPSLLLFCLLIPGIFCTVPYLWILTKERLWWPRCEIFGFCLLSFCQNERIYLSQFVYFLRKVCLFLNFWMIKCTIMFRLTHLCTLLFQNWKVNTLSSKLRKLSSLSVRELSFLSFEESMFIIQFLMLKFLVMFCLT